VVNETRGSNTVDVTLPQVSVGRDRFNSGMHAALERSARAAVDICDLRRLAVGRRQQPDHTLGPNVVGGVAIFNWYAQGAAPQQQCGDHRSTRGPRNRFC
jgi:hypothetical protein